MFLALIHPLACPQQQEWVWWCGHSPVGAWPESQQVGPGSPSPHGRRVPMVRTTKTGQGLPRAGSCPCLSPAVGKPPPPCASVCTSGGGSCPFLPPRCLAMHSGAARARGRAALYFLPRRHRVSLQHGFPAARHSDGQPRAPAGKRPPARNVGRGLGLETSAASTCGQTRPRRWL